MRIGIDARFFGPKCKGLGRYTQKLLEYLQKSDQENDYYIFLTKNGFDSFAASAKNFRKVLADYRWYGWKEQVFFPMLLKKYKLDVVHFCHFNAPIFYRKKFIVTIHDLILFHYPTIKNTTLSWFYYFFKLGIYHFVIRLICRQARKIIAVSNFTKQDIVEKIKIPSKKIEVIYEGYSIKENGSSSPKNNAVFQKYGIIKPYIMYVGNAYPHKNLERLCGAFRLLKNRFKDLKLLIVGEADYFYRKLSALVKKEKINDVVFSGFVADKDLGVLYENAEVFVFPSLYEGFGLPPLEAISKKAVVASSDRTSMPEILADGASYFNPEDENSIAEIVGKLITIKDHKQKIKKRGEERLKFFSWKTMAEKTKKEYENCL